MKNKRGFEFSFGWLFAIIIGAVIIFLAIYAATKLVKTSRETQDTELGKQLGIILNPIETGLESFKSSRIIMPVETRIHNGCEASIGAFGVQKISTATISGIGENWQNPGVPSSFRNKYLLSEKIIEGKKFTVFSKPLNMPFKIADLIYIWPEDEKYCFINAPDSIEKELKDLESEGISIKALKKECPDKSNTICFDQTGCSIEVSTTGNSIKKKGFPNRAYYENNALLYAAIFSDPDIYECQLKRLMKRAAELSLLYYSKTTFLSAKGCSSNLENDLSDYANKTSSLNNSNELTEIKQLSEQIRIRNNGLSCKLF